MSRVPSQNEIYLLHCNKSDEIFSSKFVVGVETSHYFQQQSSVIFRYCQCAYQIAFIAKEFMIIA